MSKLTDLELVTCVDLNYTQTKTGKPVYHFIYASELYGTMFAIYAKFEGREIDGGKAFEIDKMILKLVNYKGCLNIGFTSHSMEWTKGTSSDGDYYDIDFLVRGASSNFDKELDFRVEIEEDEEKGKLLKIKDQKKKLKKEGEQIQVKKGERVLVIFKRTLYPLPDFEGYLLERVDGADLSQPLKDESPATELFDNEFNARDGAEFYNRVLRPGLLDPSMPAAGHRCNTSNVNLFF